MSDEIKERQPTDQQEVDSSYQSKIEQEATLDAGGVADDLIPSEKTTDQQDEIKAEPTLDIKLDAWSEGELPKIQEAFAKAKLTPQQQQTLNEYAKSQAVTPEQALKIRTEQLKEMWGDRYNENANLAKMALNGLPNAKEITKMANESGLVNSKEFWQVLALFGAKLNKEHSMPKGAAKVSIKSPQDELQALLEDKEHQAALNSSNGVVRAKAIERETKAYEAAYPQGSFQKGDVNAIRNALEQQGRM